MMYKHRMVVLKWWPAEQVVKWIGPAGAPLRTFGTVSFSIATARLRVFKDNLTCVKCKRVGSIFILERCKDQPAGWHLNLYSKGKRGVLTLMTKDHIIPKSLGGSGHMTNYQTMCQPCNSAKGSTVEEKSCLTG